MSKFVRNAQKFSVYRFGQLDKSLQVLKIELSLGASRLDHAEMMRDPKFAEPIQDYSPIADVGTQIVIVADGFDQVVHAGIVTQVTPMTHDKGETYKFVSRTEPFLFGDPAIGAVMFAPSVPAMTDPSRAKRSELPTFTLVDDPIVFNPEIDGRTVGNKHGFKRWSVHQVPCFLDPEAVRSKGGSRLHQGPAEVEQAAVPWLLSDCVYYLCWALNFNESFCDNPDINVLANVFEDSHDLVRNVKIEDGTYLPEALDTLLNPLGYHWALRHRNRISRYLEFIRRGTGGRLVWINHQRYGEIFDPVKTNAAQLGVDFDAARLANRVVGRGSRLQLEITAELARGWPSKFDNVDPDELKKSVLNDEDDDKDKRNAWRKWVLNEGGDYIGTRPEITGIFTDRVRGDLAEWLEWFIPRRRKLLPTLTRAKDGQSPIGQIQGIEVEFRDTSSTWLPARNWGIHVLDQECGIYISAEDVPEELITQRANAKIRITATIETDFRLTAVADRLNTSPIFNDVTAQVELDRQFHWRVKTAFSKYQGSDNLSITVDDSNALQAFVDGLRDRWDEMYVSGAVALDGCDQFDYKPGDRVQGVRGKNITYKTNRDGTAFPHIGVVVYDVTAQKTILHLDRFRHVLVG